MKRTSTRRRALACLRRTSRLTLPLGPLAVLWGCGGDGSAGASSPQPQATEVTVTASESSIGAGASTAVTAIVTHDPASAGVTWSVACESAPCGAVSPAKTASGVAATYSAPGAGDAHDLTATITATAVDDTHASGTARVTVTATKITLTPGDTALAGSASQKFTASLSTPATGGKVTWTLSCNTTSCGTLSPGTTDVGAPVTYTAMPTPIGADVPVTLTARAGNVTASVTITVLGLTVTLAPAGEVNVPPGTAAGWTATVNNDVANQGVTWKITCDQDDCGALSAGQSASGETITYTAPATNTDQSVTLTATSVSAPAATASARVMVDVLAGVAIAPLSALVPLSQPTNYSATIGGSRRLSWSLTQDGVPCMPACGTLAPSESESGQNVTYTAPDSLPADKLVVVTARDSQEATQAASAAVRLTQGSVRLVPADINFVKDWHHYRVPPQGVRLTNLGPTSLEMKALSFSVQGYVASSDCGSSVPSGQSCSITIRKSDLKAPGGTLFIADSSIDSPQIVRMNLGSPVTTLAAIKSALGARSSAISPTPAGPQATGTRVLYLTDGARPDPFGAGLREVPVRLWYPTSAGSACTEAPYTSAAVRAYLGELMHATLPLVRTHSCADALAESGPHAVVLVSHGFTGMSTDYTFLAEELASHGYVVVAPNHTHESTVTELASGELVGSVFGSWITQYRPRRDGALGFANAVRVADVQFVLNELRRLNAERGGVLEDRLDLTRVAMVGHSLGGLTTLRALDLEPRIKAGVLLDGVPAPFLARPIRQPVLNIVAAREDWTGADCRLWHDLRGPRAAITLPATDHLALSDALWLLPGVADAGATTAQATASLREYVLGFLDVQLRGMASPARRLEAIPYPGARVTRELPPSCLEQ